MDKGRGEFPLFNPPGKPSQRERVGEGWREGGWGMAQTGFTALVNVKPQFFTDTCKNFALTNQKCDNI